MSRDARRPFSSTGITTNLVVKSSVVMQFLIYINDNTQHFVKDNIYADDTSITITSTVDLLDM